MILSLSLTFAILIIGLGVLLFAFILSEYLWASWTWISVSFPRLGKFSALFLQIIVLIISLSSSSRTPIMQTLFHMMLSHRSLIKVYLLFKLFFHFAAIWISLIVLFFSCLIHSSFLSHLLLNASIAFFSSLITCWISNIYFFVKFLTVLIHSSSEFSEDTHKNIYFKYVFGCY